jgi:hypothetical protein
MYEILTPTNAHRYTNIGLYVQRRPTCSGQPCGQHQEYEIQRLDAKLYIRSINARTVIHIKFINAHQAETVYFYINTKCV